MSLSAPSGLRERKMRETAAQLTSVARRLTAERGLSGFTVEEVCDEVDISRRTFFNYFASKEDAILGLHPEEESRRFAETFLARGSRGWDAVIDDLVDLVVTHFESAGFDATGHSDFIAAVEREPRLLLRFMGISRERDRQAVAFIAQREGVTESDPMAEAAAGVLSTLIRSSGERLLTAGNTQTFSEIIHGHLAALRAVLATPSSRKAHL